jgi:hypothetical protein
VLIQLTAQMHYGLDAEMGCRGSPICGGPNHAWVGSADRQRLDHLWPKHFKAADRKTEDGIVGETMDPGSEFAISDTRVSKISKQAHGSRMRFDFVSPSPASDPALLAMRT